MADSMMGISSGIVEDQSHFQAENNKHDAMYLTRLKLQNMAHQTERAEKNQMHKQMGDILSDVMKTLKQTGDEGRKAG